jgi:Cu(I)/Ag(I) efflux system protein CusF
MMRAFIKTSTLIKLFLLSVMISNVSQLIADQPEWIAAEVRNIDLENARVTLRHQEIKSLNMSAMTMGFAVEDVSILKDIKIGDSVVFSVVRKEGRLVITELKQAPHDH